MQQYSEKLSFKTKTVTGDKEGHYIMIKGSIQEDITVANIYASNIGAISIYKVNTNIIKGGIDGNTIVVGDFNTPLTPMDRSSGQKIRLNWPNWYLQDFPFQTAEYNFLSSAYGTFSRIDHILGHKLSLGKLKKTETVSSIFSDHNVIRLDINYRKKTQTHGG